MTDASSLPALTELFYFQWSTPSAPNPRLSVPIDSDDTTISWTSAPLDASGSVITAPFIMGIKNSDSYVESIYCPNGADGASGLSATGCIRGIDLAGLDFTVGDTGNAASHEQDSPVFCNITAVLNTIMVNAIQGVGDMATGGDDFVIGDGTDTNKTIKAALSGATEGFVRKNATSGKAQFSNDGTVWNNIDNVAAGSLAVVTGADTTPGNLDTKITVDADTMTKTVTSAGGDERLELKAVGGLADVIDDVTATAAEINATVGGTSATSANLDTLTAGPNSNADALHTHANAVQTYTAYETITTDDAVALLPIENEYFAQLDDEGANNEIALGDSNVRRRYAIKFTPSQVPSFTTMKIRARESAGGATTITMDVFIETDAAGEPSGAPVTNGTISAIDPSAWTATFADRTLTFPGVPTMAADTDYWLVFEANATDAANWIEIATNDDFDENYVTFTRLTYDLDAGTWGGSVTNATPFFWTVSTKKALGMALVPTDADFGGRTWPFIGFAKAGGAAQADIDIYVERVPDLAALEPNSDYYLSSTAGAITASKPTNLLGTGNSYKIGKATSTTDLTIDKSDKLYFTSETGSATTTTQLVTWFKPTFVELDWSVANSATVSTKGNGLFDGTNNYTNYFVSNDGGGEIVGIDANNTISDEGNVATRYDGAGSGVTDIGFVHTMTEVGAGATYAYLMKIHG